MRRPLFGNGIPTLSPAPAGLQVFDTTAIDPPNEKYTYELTLFMWGDTPTTALAGTIVSTVGIITSGSALVLTSAYTTAQLDALRSPNGGAIKIIDKMVVRGDQQVGIATGDDVHVYGYFERQGEHAVSSSFRPLQPTNTLVSPFNAPQAVLLPTTGATEQIDVHLLDANYIDTLDLFVSANNVAEALPDGASAAILFPGGITLPIDLQTGLPGALLASKMLDGIPLRAPDSADALIQMTVTAASATISSGTAIGRFHRG